MGVSLAKPVGADKEKIISNGEDVLLIESEYLKLSKAHNLYGDGCAEGKSLSSKYRITNY